VTNIRALVGSGDRIGLVTLPFLVVGVVLNITFPSLFTIGGPPTWLGVLSVLVLLVGVVNWAWCVYLLLSKVPRRELITTGPYAVVKHPLYTGAAILVLPWLGFLLNTWLGAGIGIVLYAASRIFAPAEEVELAQTFGGVWDAYTAKVKLPWLRHAAPCSRAPIIDCPYPGIGKHHRNHRDRFAPAPAAESAAA